MVIGTPLAGEGRPHVAAHDGGVPSGGAIDWATGLAWSLAACWQPRADGVHEGVSLWHF